MAVVTDSTSILMPSKFLLILMQALLLLTMSQISDDYLYAKVGEKFDEPSARKQFWGVIIAWVAMIGFEFICMLIGFPVANAFATNNFIQVVLHFLGLVFSAWFMLDNWRYD